MGIAQEGSGVGLSVGSLETSRGRAWEGPARSSLDLSHLI